MCGTSDARHGVRLGAVRHPGEHPLAPGYFKTAETAANRHFPEIVERITVNAPMKRYGEEEGLKTLVVFLASPASSFMTGNVIIDGGATIW